MSTYDDAISDRDRLTNAASTFSEVFALVSMNGMPNLAASFCARNQHVKACTVGHLQGSTLVRQSLTWKCAT